MKTYMIMIKVKQLVPDDKLNENDFNEHIEGEYFFKEMHETEKGAIDSALHEFHCTVPIKVLEHFEIETDIAEWKPKSEKTPYELGYADGYDSPHDLSSGYTWDDPKKNNEYDHGVNQGQIDKKNELKGR